MLERKTRGPELDRGSVVAGARGVNILRLDCGYGDGSSVESHQFVAGAQLSNSPATGEPPISGEAFAVGASPRCVSRSRAQS